MRPRVKFASIAVGLVCTIAATAQVRTGRGTVITPKSSMERPSDIGVRAHTNTRIFIPEGGLEQGAVTPFVGPPFSGFFFETPASIGCLYFLVTPRVAGCNPVTARVNPSGGAKAIAAVDAFHDPTAASDLAKFSAQFGLPAPTATTFTQVYASGTKPPLDPTGGWELEESVDIEWTHAMAPKAHIYLVEAASNSDTDLFAAVVKAAELVNAAGGGEVSMSWGGAEFSTETDFDKDLIESGVVFFVSTGDSPGPEYPSTSPNAVAVGGTTLSRNPATGAFLRESTWDLSGNGISEVEPLPSYQSSLSKKLGDHRGIPDISVDGNPVTGAWVYDSTSVDGLTPPWFVVAGTSLSAPLLAGIVNLAGNFYTSTEEELTTAYSHLGVAADFNDITYGLCGFYAGDSAAAGWDLCTGIGSVHGLVGK
jgi:kumamolisin